jgi:hypothetical protein
MSYLATEYLRYYDPQKDYIMSGHKIGFVVPPRPPWKLLTEEERKQPDWEPQEGIFIPTGSMIDTDTYVGSHWWELIQAQYRVVGKVRIHFRSVLDAAHGVSPPKTSLPEHATIDVPLDNFKQATKEKSRYINFAPSLMQTYFDLRNLGDVNKPVGVITPKKTLIRCWRYE